MLCSESNEWSDSTIVFISQVCVILHNLIVDMKRRGDLEDEVDEQGNAVDVEREFGLSAPHDNNSANHI